jgi:predicted O-methyltransferase YrrM
MGRDSEVPSTLSLDGEWAIGEGAFSHIVDVLHDVEAQHILEFGSGPSSVRLARTFPKAQVVSVEGSRKYYEKTQALRRECGVEDRLTVLYLPLEFNWYGLSRIQSYQRVDHAGSFDAVIVDGPPHWTLRGREACLYQVYDRIREGGVVILDDYSRTDEQNILQNWLATYPNSFRLSVEPVNDHLAVLRKVQEVRPRWFAPRRILDNLRANVRHIRPKVSGALPEPIRSVLCRLRRALAS